MVVGLCELTNAGSFGGCLIQNIFGGDFLLGSLFLLFGIIVLMVRFGLPFETIYPVAIATTFLLWIVSGSTIMLGFFILTLVVAGGLLAYALFNYFRSW